MVNIQSIQRPLFQVLLMGGLFLSGCATALNPTFVQSMREHRQDTMLVNNALIDTFQKEMDKDDRPEAKSAYQKIINNLKTISHQSEVLEKYIWNNLTEEELILILKTKWRTKS